MRTNQWTLKVLSFLFLAACGTKQVTQTEPTYRTPVPSRTSEDSGAPNIDYAGLKRHLGLDRPNNQLGYAEKAFDTCQVGYGYSSTKYCYRQVFVVLNFHLLCRDSEGTVTEGINNSEQMALSNRPVRWNLKGISGEVQTDSDGFGQIQTISPISQRRERVKLGVGSEFLYMRANEITKVLTPKPWCNSY